MNLLSVSFLMFFVGFCTIYYLVPHRLQWICLLAGSIVFYLKASPWYFIFLMFSIATTFAAGILMEQMQKIAGRKKGILAAAILLNVGLLLLAKFGPSAVEVLGGIFHLECIRGLSPRFLMPLGISFYTLQVVAYCIDVYRGNQAAEKNFARYMLFAAFFPQMIQGPIARYGHLAHQLYEEHCFQFKEVRAGIQLVIWGCFKKMVIADRAALLVNTVFDNLSLYSGFELFIASICYTLQLYADFSGFVDISRGVAQVLGISLGKNFNHPYFAQSIQDFWRRWHISLSTWLRDYVYIPLGGNRKGVKRKYLNIMVVFFVSGLWHGVGAQFIVWGLLHGAYQVAGEILRPVRDRCLELLETDRNSFSHRLFKGVLTFALVDFAWIFFRAPSLSQALLFVWKMVSRFNPWIFFDGSIYAMGLDSKDFWLLLFSVIILGAVSLCQEKGGGLRRRLARQSPSFQFLVTALAVLGILVLGVYGPGYHAADFIYANF